jgi:hypothetical protein
MQKVFKPKVVKQAKSAQSRNQQGLNALLQMRRHILKTHPLKFRGIDLGRVALDPAKQLIRRLSLRRDIATHHLVIETASWRCPKPRGRGISSIQT